MGVLNLASKRVKNVKMSGVSDHLLHCNCTTDFNHFDILASDTNSFGLLVKESLLIKRDKPVLNGSNLYRTHSLYYIIRIIYLTIELFD